MAQKLRRLLGGLPGALSVFFGLLLAAILALMIFWQDAYRQYYDVESLLSNLALAAAALAALAVCLCARTAALRRRPAPRACAGVPWALLLADAALLAAQLVIVRSTWYYAGWDVAACYQNAEQLALTGATDPSYFQLCPNNAPFTLLIAIPLWAAGKLGLAVPYAVLPYLSAVLVNLACLLCALCARRLTRSRAATAGVFALCAVWVGLSPYISVPYTDTFAIVFPVLALYCWLSVKQSFCKWALVTLCCFTGYALKPAVLIVWIALVIVGGLRFLSQKAAAGSFKRIALILLAMLLGFVPAKLFKDGATAYLAGSATPQGQLSETHYLMMGLNPDTYGGHSPEDVAFSTSFDTLAERRAANLERAVERLNDKGFAGGLQFFSVKAYKAYADGTFASNKSLLVEQKPKRDDALSKLLRSFYFTDGAHRQSFATVGQGLWLFVLLGCCVSAFVTRGRSAAVPVLTLALLGVTLYLLLVEVWPRYLYIFSPLYALLAVLGLEDTAGRLAKGD